LVIVPTLLLTRSTKYIGRKIVSETRTKDRGQRNQYHRLSVNKDMGVGKEQAQGMWTWGS